MTHGKLPTRVIFNGKEYRSVEEMPPSVRTQYEKLLASLPDDDKDGVPDLLQGDHAAATFTSVSGVDYTGSGNRAAPAGAPDILIEVNGVQYRSPADMPADVRETYEKMMALLDRDGDGRPDFLDERSLAGRVVRWSTRPVSYRWILAASIAIQLLIMAFVLRDLMG